MYIYICDIMSCPDTPDYYVYLSLFMYIYMCGYCIEQVYHVRIQMYTAPNVVCMSKQKRHV